MDNKNKILKYSLFLLILCLTAGLLLSFVNSITAPRIKQREKEKVIAALRAEFDYDDYSLGKKGSYPDSDKAIEDIFFAFDKDGSLAAVIYQTAVPGYEKAGFVRTFVEIKRDGTFGMAKMISHNDTATFADKLFAHDFGMAGQNVNSYEIIVAGVTPKYTLAAVTAGFDAAAAHFKTIQDTLGGIKND